MTDNTDTTILKAWDGYGAAVDLFVPAARDAGVVLALVGETQITPTVAADLRRLGREIVEQGGQSGRTGYGWTVSR